MSWTSTLIKSLKEWDEMNPGRSFDLRNINFIVGFVIGAQDLFEDDDLSGLEKHLRYLVNDLKIDEEFLINSIINEITRVLRNDINELGEAIIIREGMINDLIENQLAEASGYLVTSLEEMKSPERIVEAEATITDWEKVLLNNFSLIQRRLLRQEHSIKADERIRKSFEH